LIKNKNFLYAKIEISLLILLSAAFSALYGFQLYKNPGTDFGIYYAGANATSPSYRLYDGFFETKGPLFYGFIKFLNLFLPYSIFGAAITLSLVSLFWFFSIYLSSNILELQSKFRFLLFFMGAAVFIQQPSNGSINVFMCSLFMLSIAFSIRYFRNNLSKDLVFGVLFASLASLTKLDGFLILPVCFVILYLSRNRKLFFTVIVSVLLSAFFYFTSLLLLQNFLYFKLSSYWRMSFKDVFERVWNPNNNGSILNLVVRDYNSLGILLASGTIFIFVLFYKFAFINRSESHLIYILLFFGFAGYLALGSDKNYHIFIVYPFILVSILILMPRIDDTRIIKTATILVILSTITISLNLAVLDKCAFVDKAGCTNRYTEIIQKTKNNSNLDSIFFLNQGWPFIYAKVKPIINFTATWDGWNNELYYDSLRKQASNGNNEAIWVDLFEIESNKIGADLFLKTYFPNRHIGEGIKGTTFYPMILND
jgi:hypothetical protein